MENQNNEEQHLDLGWKNDLAKETDKIKAEGLHVETVSISGKSNELNSVLSNTESTLLSKCPDMKLKRLCTNISFSEGATLSFDDMSAINDFTNRLSDNVDFTWYMGTSNDVHDSEILIEAVGGFAN